MNRIGSLKSVALALVIGLLTGRAAAFVQPFTEHFNSGSASWFGPTTSTPATWFASGGPDGSGYISASLGFASAVEDEALIFLRGHHNLGSSGQAFSGDWIASGIDHFSFFVRHDAPVPVQFFTRFASPLNFPGGLALEPTPVEPGVWTQINIPINPANPQFLTFEGSTFAGVFSNVGNIQFGLLTAPALAGSDTIVHFDIDMVSIVPGPASLALMGIGIVPLARRRRRSGSRL